MPANLEPKFRNLPEDYHQIGLCPETHILPRTEKVFYALTWLMSEGVWYVAGTCDTLGRMTMTPRAVMPTTQAMPDLLRTWRDCKDEGILADEPDVGRIMQEIRLGCLETTQFVVVRCHLGADEMANVLRWLDSGEAVEEWVPDHDPDLFSEQELKTSRWYLDYGKTPPYADDGFARTRRIPIAAQLFRIGSQPSTRTKAFFL